MAFASVGTLGSNNNKASGTTLVITTSNTLEVGNLGVVFIAADNVDTSSGPTSLVSSVVDSAGNTWTKITEYTNGQGSAGAGIMGAAWYTKATIQLASGGTITITFASAITAKAASAWEYSMDTSKVIAVDGINDTAVNNDDPPSKTVTGSNSGEHIWIRVLAAETEDPGMTVSGTWTGITRNQTTGGVDTTNAAIKGEFIIGSGVTSPASNPSIGSYDFADVMFGLIEQAAASGLIDPFGERGFFGI